MPELPEVETIRQDLRQKLLNKKIVRLVVLNKKSIQAKNGLSTKVVQGLRIKEIERRGKLLIFVLSAPDTYLLIHLKMTGQLIYRIRGHIIAGGHKLPHKFGSLPGPHTRAYFTFADKSQLFFNDLRKFGYIKLTDARGKDMAESHFGIEALDKRLTLEGFKDILGKRAVSVKAVLLDQTKIAGIGNIYADEICFCARVMPDRKVKNLKEAEIKKILACIPSVLKIAVKNRGTTFSDYLDSEGKNGGHAKFLKVYDCDGDRCKRCKKGIIKKKRAAGRGTHYCPVCQI